MGLIYVILESYNDVLYKVNSWSKNYYVATMYYSEFKKTHPDTLLVEYECDKVRILYRSILDDGFIVDIPYLIDNCLCSMTSSDGNLTMIYPCIHDRNVKDDRLIFALTRTAIGHFDRQSTWAKFFTNYFKGSQDTITSMEQHLCELETIDPVYLWYLVLNRKDFKRARNILNDWKLLPKNLVFVRRE